MTHMKKRKQVDDNMTEWKVRKRSNGEKNKNAVVSQETSYICKEEIPYLSEEIIHNIQAELPFDSLLNSRLVCKMWSNIISNPIVTYSSLLQSEPGLLIQQVEMSKGPHYKTYFMAMKDEQITVREFSIPYIGNIHYSCNGLVLFSRGKRDNLCIANFVTKQQVTLPCHTLSDVDVVSISLGFAFVPSSGQYKVVHLYWNKNGRYLQCEILTLGSNKWRHVDLPPFAIELRLGRGIIPVSVKGFLHWYSCSMEDSRFILSMDVCDEKFYSTPLPSSSRPFKLLNIGSFLALFSRDSCKLTLWILKDSYQGIWVIQLIDLQGMPGSNNLCTIGILGSLKNGKVIIFRRRCNKSESCYYAYDIEHHQMWQVAINVKKERRNALAHVNSLISLETIQ